WAKWLTDRQNADKRFQASKALENMGAAAAPYLLDALRNGKEPEVRLAAMEALTPASMAPIEKPLCDQLLELLKDRNPEVRAQAASRLAWFDHTSKTSPEPGYKSDERLMALQAQYHFDSDANVRLAARTSLLSVYDHRRRSFDCPPVQNIFI